MSDQKTKFARELAEKLRISSNNQFKCLVNMHLTYILDFSSLSFISTDENEPMPVYDKSKGKKWIGFHKKAKSCHKSNSPPENLPALTEETIKNMKKLIEFLQLEENISQEGIFRKTGSVSRQQELKFLINQNKEFHLEKGEYTAHDCASVLKSLLADLPEPLLTETYYPAYGQVAEICNSSALLNESRIKDALQLLFLLLPKENSMILEYLIILLHNTSLLESKNKMNADTLATLFTPHLICPKKLTPETLHQTAAKLSCVISFIIKCGQTIFDIPDNLLTDIKAYFVEQKRRKTMSPEKILDESTSDSVANTVFTFVDHKRSVEEDAGHTDSQLAQLYAHIQSLPESRQKKKLIKQFNKQNGHGTPLQLVMLNRENKTSSCRSISDSIKKHIFHKNLIHKTPKRSSHSHSSNTPSTSLNSPVTFQTPNSAIPLPKSRVLFQSPAYSVNSPKSLKESPASAKKCASDVCVSSSKVATITATPATVTSTVVSGNDSSEQYYSLEEKSESSNDGILDLQDAVNNFPSDDEDFCSSSESLDRLDDKEPSLKTMTPSKSRSESDLLSLESDDALEMLDEFRTPYSRPALKKLIKGVSMGNLKFPFPTLTSPGSLKKSKSSTVLSDDRVKLLNDSDVIEVEESMKSFKSFIDRGDNWDVSKINYFQNTSTIKEEQQTTRNSMSPITKSTTRMPKAMQESIMTPRSRKPVMLMGAMFGGLDDQKPFQSPLLEDDSNSLTEDNSNGQQQYEQFVNSESSGSSCSESAGNSGISETLTLKQIDENAIPSAVNDNGLPEVGTAGQTLSRAFLSYMNRRSLVTDNLSVVDDSSFCSQPNDYNSSMDEDFESKKENSSSELEKLINMSEGDLSESMLYCMDGNDVSVADADMSKSSRKRTLSGEDEDKNCSKIFCQVSTETNL